MNNNYSESELMSFMEYLTSKNLINSSTASAKKAAVIKVLSAIDENEKDDLRTLDRDQVFQRFSNKFAKEFTPESLVTYKSRFNSILNDFFNFKDNPAGFKPGGGTKKTLKENGNSGKKTSPPRVEQNIAHPSLANHYTLQIPISDGTLLEIRNFPKELKVMDAEKIAAIVIAHAPKK